MVMLYRASSLLEFTLDQVKSNEVLVVMGDLNAKVGQERNGNIVGPCGMGEYLGHIIRHNTSQIQLIEGKIEGRRSRGRPRNTWINDITTTNGMNYYQLKRAVEDRKIWHGLVVNLAQETTLR